MNAWVEGMVVELAKVIFGLEIDMQLLRGRQLGNCDHEVRPVRDNARDHQATGCADLRKCQGSWETAPGGRGRFC